MCRVLTSIQRGLKKVHIAQNVFTDPLKCVLDFFSNLMQFKMPLIQRVEKGGAGDLHLSRINHLANKSYEGNYILINSSKLQFGFPPMQI